MVPVYGQGSGRDGYTTSNLKSAMDGDPFKMDSEPRVLEIEDIDLVKYYEDAAGRLVVDPQ